MKPEPKQDRKPRGERLTFAQKIARHDATISRYLARAEKAQAARRALIAAERERVESLSSALDQIEPEAKP